MLRYIGIVAVAIVVMVACKDDNPGPFLGDSSTFTAPVWKNSGTTDAKELLSENATDTYELFSWEKTNYGVKLSTDYVIEVDVSEDFERPQTLIETSTDSVMITVEKMNNTMLALGLPGFEESTVYLRIRSTINDYEGDTLYSNVITRVATTYQDSECGNYCTMGLAGSATPGGWDVDSDMRLADATKVDKYTWTVTIYLTSGAVKFRANDGWDNSWGGSDFPTGTGTQGGSDISISAAGYYKVTFNDQTGSYTFTALAASEFTTIGVIGSATPGGWDTDTDLTKDAGDPHVWTGVITLTNGDAKFRAENDWANNWGSNTYPYGFGIGNGDNVPVKAGTYVVRFHDVTGEYMFMPQSSATPFDELGIIGPATPGGWTSDTDLIQSPVNPFIWSKIITLTEGEGKFRADNDWTDNWGASTFPGGIGAQDGPNIPVKAGKYFITFNTGTGEYYFLK